MCVVNALQQHQQQPKRQDSPIESEQSATHTHTKESFFICFRARASSVPIVLSCVRVYACVSECVCIDRSVCSRREVNATNLVEIPQVHRTHTPSPHKHAPARKKRKKETRLAYACNYLGAICQVLLAALRFNIVLHHY